MNVKTVYGLLDVALGQKLSLRARASLPACKMIGGTVLLGLQICTIWRSRGNGLHGVVYPAHLNFF